MSSSGALGFGSYRRVVAGSPPIPAYFSAQHAAAQPATVSSAFFKAATAPSAPWLSPLLHTRSAHSFTATALLLLHESHRRVQQTFLVRDRVIQPLVLPPHATAAPSSAKSTQHAPFYEGIFALTPARRHFYHNKEVMESIRLRSLLRQRLLRQRKRNEVLLQEIEREAGKEATEASAAGSGKRASLHSPSFLTPDSNVYFAPWQRKSEVVRVEEVVEAPSQIARRHPKRNRIFVVDGMDSVNAQPNYWQDRSQAHVLPQMRWRRVPELGGITRVLDPLAEQANDY